MLSYQHHYHAGNHADVIKHWLLVECIEHLQKKDKPFDYIDTHAGAGYYELDSNEARKTAESDHGVLKLDWSKHPGLANYQQLIETDLRHRCYPGSPMFVKRKLRQGDHAWLFEMHPQTHTELQQHCAQKRVCYVQKEDGFAGVLRLLPNQSRRALVLIDPSYEIKSDYQTVVKTIEKIYKKMPQTMILLWYPVVNRSQIDSLEKGFINSSIKNVQLFELGVANDDQQGMQASGMIVVNPPWTLADKFKSTMPNVSKELAVDGKDRSRFVQLVNE